MRKMQHSEQSISGLKYKQEDRFNFKRWRSHVQFILTSLVHSNFQSRARINDQTEAPKCRSPEVTRGYHVNQEKVTSGFFHPNISKS
jgi:hypothetical protein